MLGWGWGTLRRRATTGWRPRPGRRSGVGRARGLGWPLPGARRPGRGRGPGGGGGLGRKHAPSGTLDGVSSVAGREDFCSWLGAVLLGLGLLFLAGGKPGGDGSLPQRARKRPPASFSPVPRPPPPPSLVPRAKSPPAVQLEGSKQQVLLPPETPPAVRAAERERGREGRWRTTATPSPPRRPSSPTPPRRCVAAPPPRPAAPPEGGERAASILPRAGGRGGWGGAGGPRLHPGPRAPASPRARRRAPPALLVSGGAGGEGGGVRARETWLQGRRGEGARALPSPGEASAVPPPRAAEPRAAR